MIEMKTGDRFLFYHSNIEHPEIIGVGRVVKPNLPDPSALDKTSPQYDPKSTIDRPIWFCAKFIYEGHLLHPLRLEQIKDIKELANMALLTKGKRLSIQPVREVEFDLILRLAGGLKDAR